MSLNDLTIIDKHGNRYKVVPERTSSTALVASPSPVKVTTSGTNPVLTPSFGAKLREKREGEKISITTLAGESKVKQPNISNIELGKRKARISTQRKLIKAWESLSKKTWQ